ncbi:MAG: serine/threonine-protein kinase [Rubripirellula sp.]
MADNAIDPRVDGSCDGVLDAPTVSVSAACSLRKHSQALPLPGMLVDDYEVIDEVARGAMGVVYRARHPSLDRVVAIKMVLDDTGCEDLRRRFSNEARVAASLDHPGIVPIFNVGVWQGHPYFAMLFVDGQTLATMLRDGPMLPNRSAEIALEVAEAIEHAHQTQIIHRDLKPANILIDSDGNARVTDFGISKVLNSASDLTQAGELIGTPHFMPPEQAGNSIVPAGPSSDVYSIGAVLYAMLTGRPPFQATSPLEVVSQVIGTIPISPSALNASVPIELEMIAMKCLGKRTQDRYSTAHDLACDLKRFLAGEPIAARPPGWIGRARFFVRKHVILASVSGTASLLLVVLTASMFVSWLRTQNNVSDLTDELLVTKQLLESERRTVSKFIAARHSSDPSVSLTEFQVRRLGNLVNELTATDPDLALQLSIASLQIATASDHNTASVGMRSASERWLRNRLADIDEEGLETESLSVPELIEAALAHVKQSLTETQRQLYGIDPLPPDKAPNPGFSRDD